MGWVSLFDPEAVGELLDMPEDAKPVAILCLGEVDAFYDRPMLQREGWDEVRELGQVVMENKWENEYPGC